MSGLFCGTADLQGSVGFSAPDTLRYDDLAALPMRPERREATVQS